jgi:hypothetical protein
METTATESRIRKEVSKSTLDVSRVYSSDYQKEGTQTAELRQKVTTKSFYPTKAIANDKQDNVFGMEEFGFEEQEYVNEENRVAWIDVPVGTTIEQVKAKLAAHPTAGLYRILANKPILTDNQKYAVENNIASYDTFANSQVVRFPEGAERAGELALDQNGKPQYRAIFFKKEDPVDQDLRTMDEVFYASPQIQEELNENPHVVTGQQL